MASPSPMSVLLLPLLPSYSKVTLIHQFGLTQSQSINCWRQTVFPPTVYSTVHRNSKQHIPHMTMQMIFFEDTLDMYEDALVWTTFLNISLINDHSDLSTKISPKKLDIADTIIYCSCRLKQGESLKAVSLFDNHHITMSHLPNLLIVHITSLIESQV